MSKRRTTYASGMRDCALAIVDQLEERRLLSASGVTVNPPVIGVTPPTSQFQASSMVEGPDGNVWFTDQNSNSIGRETPAGAVTEFPIPTDNAGPDQIVVGPDGNLWFLETDLSQIAKITTSGKVSEFAMPSGDSTPSALAVGPGGDVWFVDSGSNEIGKITPGGAVTEFSFDQTNLAFAGGIVEGPDGNLYAGAQDDSGNGVLARMTPAGKITSISLPDYPTDLTVGPDGNLWVDCSGAIDRVTTSGVATSFAVPNQDSTFGITSGPDGALWWGTYGANPMGRMTTAGDVVEFNPPGVGQNGFVDALAAGPGKQIWYATDSGAPTSFDPHDALLAGGVNATATAGTSSTVTIASFVDLAPGGAVGDYSGTIDWGDGTTSVGMITANSQSGFDVSGTHTWGIGSSNVTVTIADTRSPSTGLGGRTAVAYATVTSPAPPTQGTGVNIKATAGQLFTGVVANYTGVILSSLSSYSANIDWGDGHFTSGAITLDGQGGVVISGSNRYAHSGSYTVTTNLWPWSFGPIVPIAQGGGLLAARGRIVAPPGKAIPLAGSTTAPTTVSGGTGLSGGTGSGSIIPAPPIPEPPIPLPNPNGTSSTATVAQGVMDGTGYTLLASSSTPFSGDVASFTVTDPNADLSHFHATVKWSDPGTFDWFTLPNPNVTNATITPVGQGGFTVSVTNVNLGQFGWYHYQVLISDDRLGTGDTAIVGAAYGQVVIDTPIRPIPLAAGAVANAAGAVKISGGPSTSPDPALSEHVKFSAVSIKGSVGHMFSGKLGVISGLASGTSLSQLAGTIDWGDGTTTPAQFIKDHARKIEVRGGHAYSSPGKPTITLFLTQSLSSVAEESNPPIHLSFDQTKAEVIGHAKTGSYHVNPTGPIHTTAGQQFTSELGLLIGPPIATGRSLQGTVGWGDGSSSAAQIAITPSGLWEISGSHKYGKKGNHAVHVVVTLVGTTHSVIARFALRALVATPI
jgi:virginiamycin B lyase